MSRALFNPHLRRIRFLIILCAVLSLVLSPSTPAISQAPPPQQAAPAQPLDVPVVVVNEWTNEYRITDGLLYWANACFGNEFRSAGYLRRMPTHGGPLTTLQTTTSAQCYTFWWMGADSTGIYYLNYETNTLEFRAISTPTQAVILHTFTPGNYPVADFDLDDTYIYWAAETNRILRMPKAGGEAPTVIANTAAGLSDIELQWNRIHWLDNTGMWSCTQPDCTGPVHQDTVAGRHLKAFLLGVMWNTTTSPERIRAYMCVFSCGYVNLYTGAANWRVEKPAFGSCPEGYCIYFTEYDLT